MTKIWNFIKRHWPKLLFVLMLAVTILLVIVTFGRFRFRMPDLQKSNEPEPHRPNSVAETREQRIGEVDQTGNVQIPVVEVEKVKIVDLPEGIKTKDLVEVLDVRPKTDASKTEDHFKSFFDNDKEQPRDPADDQPIRFSS